MSQQGGSDTIPVTYTYAVATTVWLPRDPDQQGYFLQRCVPSVAFGTVQITGNSTEVQHQVSAYGVTRFRVGKTNVGMTKAPAYIDVVANGVQYKIQVGVTATAPANVFSLINVSGGDYTATIV